MDPALASYREQYRRQRISRLYRGWLHFAFTSLGSLAVIVYAISRAHEVAGPEYLTIPATFVLANFVEYMVHRGPMHHRRRGLFLLFKRHTLEHHRFFSDTDMHHEGSRDFAAVLFPPVMLIFFLGFIAAPIGALLFMVATSNIAWLFVATALGYFLNYELLHFAYHQGNESWLSRLPFVPALRRLHTKHHDPKSMSKANFNITYPLFDLLFKTYRN